MEANTEIPGIASGDENAIAKIVGGVENLDIRAAVLGSFAATTASLIGKYQGTGEWWRRNQPFVDATKLHGLARMQRLPIQAAASTSSERRPVGSASRKGEKIFHLYF